MRAECTLPRCHHDTTEEMTVLQPDICRKQSDGTVLSVIAPMDQNGKAFMTKIPARTTWQTPNYTIKNHSSQEFDILL